MRQTIPALLFSLLVSPAGAGDYTGRVVGISDGDTLTVLRDCRTQVKIRLHGIDAPETGQDFGARAKAASELAFRQVVTVKPRDVDRYGRTVAVVILPDGRSLNEEQVRRVIAVPCARPAGDSRTCWPAPGPLVPSGRSRIRRSARAANFRRPGLGRGVLTSAPSRFLGSTQPSWEYDTLLLKAD